MRYRFPYEKVEKNEKVLLYGAGVIGQSLLWEIRDSEYCNFVGIVDEQFNDSCTPPFFSVNAIPSLNFDKVVIASLSSVAVLEMQEKLIKYGIPESKIIISKELRYPAVAHLVPLNSLPEAFSFYDRFFRVCKMSDSSHAGDYVYQTNIDLDIDGRRDTSERIKAYELESFLDKKHKVLDIGCNCGLFDLSVSKYVDSIKGIDIDGNMIEMANMARDYLQIQNACFCKENIFEASSNEKYDVVFAFAIHKHVIREGTSKDDFAKTLASHIQPNGLLFFESHINKRDRKDLLFEELLQIFLRNNMEMLMFKRRYGKTDQNANRDIAIFLKT